MTATPPTRHYLLSAWCMCPRCSTPAALEAEDAADGGRGVLDTPAPAPEPPDPEDFV